MTNSAMPPRTRPATIASATIMKVRFRFGAAPDVESVMGGIEEPEFVAVRSRICSLIGVILRGLGRV